MGEDYYLKSEVVDHSKATVPGNDTCSEYQRMWFSKLTQRAESFLQRHGRPMVTVTYAQSVDGSIATRNRKPLLLSSPDSMVLTHRLRAGSDAILIGINTLIIDDPQLTVRLVEGENPQPIVLDSNLRVPAKARIFQRDQHRCLLAGTTKNGYERISEIEKLGGEVLRCRPDPRGRVDLPHLLEQLGQRGIRSIMVEGGSQVITSFLESRLVDQLIITISPRLVGGLPVLERSLSKAGQSPMLDNVTFQLCGPDFVLWAQPRWQ